jgi:hypothetical protein
MRSLIRILILLLPGAAFAAGPTLKLDSGNTG